MYQPTSGKCVIDGTVPELHCVNMKHTEIDGVIRCMYEPNGNKWNYIV